MIRMGMGDEEVRGVTSGLASSRLLESLRVRENCYDCRNDESYEMRCVRVNNDSIHNGHSGGSYSIASDHQLSKCHLEGMGNELIVIENERS
ncbi:hypothetical protein PMAYCL1PPCAC_31393 [Pristionchus mayeri]|uniref:Uncharacterized protein n=1 Tax=Pristionchus mayeri TaxID=1317129 RepID=A0AAN5ICK4_9BILA|nr:hypothetical protein PMAYCL1PPCAC_31393 [Pristionchus mayeri]